MDLNSEASKMFLIWGSGSVPCWRAMITLEEKGLSGYGRKLISFAKNEAKSEEILKLNPRGEVPTFRHGDIVLNESFGICMYLEDIFKEHGTKLIPDEPAMKAKVLQRMYERISKIKDIMFYKWGDRNAGSGLQYQAGGKEHDQEKKSLLSARCKIFSDELKVWNEYLSEATYLAGESFSMADVIFFPALAQLVRGSLPLETRANLKRYYEQLSQRPSIKAGWPPHFLTTPATQIFADV